MYAPQRMAKMEKIVLQPLSTRLIRMIPQLILSIYISCLFLVADSFLVKSITFHPRLQQSHLKETANNMLIVPRGTPISFDFKGGYCW